MISLRVYPSAHSTLMSLMSRFFVMDAALKVGCNHHFLVSRRKCLVTKGHSDFLQRMASSLDVVPVSKSG